MANDKETPKEGVEKAQPQKPAPDILDELKATEMAIRKYILIKMVSDIKVMAKEILKMKEKTSALLKETGLSEEDAKRVIDFLNSQPTVQLTADDKDDIKAWAKKEVENARKKLEDKMEKSEAPFIPIHMDSLMHSDNLVFRHLGGNTTGDMRFRSPYNTGDPLPDFGTVTFCSSAGGEEIKVKI